MVTNSLHGPLPDWQQGPDPCELIACQGSLQDPDEGVPSNFGQQRRQSESMRQRKESAATA